jgi:hypothetical protein
MYDKDMRACMSMFSGFVQKHSPDLKYCRPEYKQSIQEIAGILREIEEKIE